MGDLQDEAAALSVAEVGPKRAEGAGEKTPIEKAAVVDSVRAARRAYVVASARVAALKQETGVALLEEAVALENLKRARETLKKEAEDGP